MIENEDKRIERSSGSSINRYSGGDNYSYEIFNKEMMIDGQKKDTIN